MGERRIAARRQILHGSQADCSQEADIAWEPGGLHPGGRYCMSEVVKMEVWPPQGRAFPETRFKSHFPSRKRHFFESRDMLGPGGSGPGPSMSRDSKKVSFFKRKVALKTCLGK